MEPGGFFWKPHDGHTTGLAAAIGPTVTLCEVRSQAGTTALPTMSSYAVLHVPREVPSAPGPSAPLAPLAPLEVGAAEGTDELDPELLALPNPPRRERTLNVGVLLLSALAALAMVFLLRRDVAYAFANGTPFDVGDLRTATAATLSAGENRMVDAQGLLGAAGGIRYERPFVEDSFRAVPVVGRKDVWVELRVPAGQEGGRWQPPSGFAGRLVRFAAAGPRHRGLASAIEGATGEKIAPGAWLLVDGAEPAGARWAVVLAAMFLGFAIGNGVAVGKILKRVT